MKRILVIVVTWNALPWIEKCLSSVLSCSIKTDILVVDNLSSDGTPSLIRESFPMARLIEPGKNLGFGAGNNIGLEIALEEGYDYAYLLNQDAYMEKDTLERMLAADPEGRYGILSPVQTAADGSLDRNFERKCGKFLSKGSGGVAEVPFVMAAHWLMGRDTIVTVGGFSPAFNQYGEDDNYLHRLHYHSLKVGIATDARAVHDRASRPDSKQRRMRLKCISAVVKFCNPARSTVASRILESLELAGMCVRNLSLIPLKFLPGFLKDYPRMEALREESKKKGAFLHECTL